MVAENTFKNAYVSQRAIYDERYEVGRYDHRSAVRVLTAERDALGEAMDRVLKMHRTVRRINLFDFGYGTGRVTNEFIGSYVHNYAGARKDLRVVAYDVSSAGLRKAKEALYADGFKPVGPICWLPGHPAGYIAGRVAKTEAGITITVVFVHGHESKDPSVMRGSPCGPAVGSGTCSPHRGIAALAIFPVPGSGGSTSASLAGSRPHTEKWSYRYPRPETWPSCSQNSPNGWRTGVPVASRSKCKVTWFMRRNWASRTFITCSAPS